MDAASVWSKKPASSRRAAARGALHLFVRPRRHPVPAREREVLARGERSDVRVGERRIAAWTWQPSGGPTRGTAYLVHGWEGRGGQLSAFADPLVAEGFRVVAFDHVGHGESDGVRCSLPTLRDTLAAVVAVVVDPAGQVRGLAGLFNAEFAASVRSLEHVLSLPRSTPKPDGRQL